MNNALRKERPWNIRLTSKSTPIQSQCMNLHNAGKKSGISNSGKGMRHVLRVT
jgi:hypothetical protein